MASKKKTSKKKMTAEQKRKARNEYSRLWKQKHKKQVKQWNKEWRSAQKKIKAGHKPKAYRKVKKAA